MESLDFWRLSEELSVIQAALLLVGCDPSSEDGYAESWDMDKRPKGYEAAKTAITNAFRRGAIKGRLVPHYSFDPDFDPHEGVEIEDSINLAESLVEVDSLRQWLVTRGIRTGFFFPVASNSPDYLDPNNKRYAPKLAAAISAWQAIIDPKGKSPRQALEKWLREHATKFAMTDDNGNPVNLAVRECAKVANWETVGGAPRTPAKSNPPIPKA
ncbi:MAG: hypothetical protein RLZZ464_531 [Pseudomonadota bacterium]|jgi:hypothetical protein